MAQRPAPAPALRVPLLENGDRLTRVEFERRYDAHPEIKKAELIDGRVYVAGPVRTKQHGAPEALLGLLLSTYAAESPHLMVTLNSTLRVDEDNEPQPDLVLRTRSDDVGPSRIDDDGYLEGAPELVAEITASSVSYDLHDKLHLYRRIGVQEYLVWRTIDGAIDWFRLVEGRYEPLEPNAEGVVSSEVFPGLRVDAPALLAGRDRAALDTLRGGLGDPAVRAFLDGLAGPPES